MSPLRTTQLSLWLVILLQCVPPAFGAFEKGNTPQSEDERSIQAVVRNKEFYKTGRLEILADAGVMPYDSLVNHYMVGGRLTWHLSDHIGWEVIDFQLPLASVTGLSTGLVQDKGISNLQTLKLRLVALTNLLVSPLYGKVRFFGSSTVHFDVYLVIGAGMANTETIKLSSPGTGQPAVESVVSSGFNPMFNFGFGFKLFMTKAIGIVVDFRDYLAYSELYGGRTLKSNFSVFAGINFFLPTF